MNTHTHTHTHTRTHVHTHAHATRCLLTDRRAACGANQRSLCPSTLRHWARETLSTPSRLPPTCRGQAYRERRGRPHSGAPSASWRTSSFTRVRIWQSLVAAVGQEVSLWLHYCVSHVWSLATVCTGLLYCTLRTPMKNHFTQN